MPVQKYFRFEVSKWMVPITLQYYAIVMAASADFKSSSHHCVIYYLVLTQGPAIQVKYFFYVTVWI